MIDLETLHTTKIDNAIILTTDQTIKDQNLITIIIDHATFNRTKFKL